MDIDSLDNIDSAGIVAGDEDLVALDTGDRSGVEIRSSQDSTRITVRGENTEVTVELDGEDRIQNVERNETGL